MIRLLNVYGLIYSCFRVNYNRSLRKKKKTAVRCMINKSLAKFTCQLYVFLRVAYTLAEKGDCRVKA